MINKVRIYFFLITLKKKMTEEATVTEEKKETAGKRSEHIERIRPAVQELDQIAKSAQIQWLQMGALFDGIALKHNKQKKPKVTPFWLVRAKLVPPETKNTPCGPPITNFPVGLTCH